MGVFFGTSACSLTRFAVGGRQEKELTLRRQAAEEVLKGTQAGSHRHDCRGERLRSEPPNLGEDRGHQRDWFGVPEFQGADHKSS